MINEIIKLLPSADLKARIKETKHQFTEFEQLQIIYRYATTLKARVALLEQFAELASFDASALANTYIKYEQEKLDRFTKASEGFVYELCIKVTPDSYEEKYLCSSYLAALVCIDRFYENYAVIDTKENDKTRYRVLKRKIFSENDRFDEDEYAEIVLGPHKTVLTVSDYRNPADCQLEDVGCSECNENCPYRCDTLYFPHFAHDRAIIKYNDYTGAERYGVNLCFDNERDKTGVELLYVIPLDSSPIREHQLDDCFCGHEHVEPPLATLATPDDLDETMRKNYFELLAYLEQSNRYE